MADLTTKQIKDIEINDKIIGIIKEKRGRTSRYNFSITNVLNKFKSERESYEITLENGMNVVCSEDHRWLTKRGWKYTVGSMGGKKQRPYLTSNDRIKGIEKIYSSLPETNDYKKGYLSGMIYGDGLLRKYKDKRYPKSENCRSYQFRLVLNDECAILRTKKYLSSFNIRTFDFEFKQRNHLIKSIRINQKKAFYNIKKIIDLSIVKSPEWYRGYMAGLFDSEGSFHKIITIANTNLELLDIFKEEFEL